MARKGGGFWGFVRAILIAGLIVFFIGPVVMVAIYRFVPPPVTITVWFLKSLMVCLLKKG